jgi:hypothetical protein
MYRAVSFITPMLNCPTTVQYTVDSGNILGWKYFLYSFREGIEGGGGGWARKIQEQKAHVPSVFISTYMRRPSLTTHMWDGGFFPTGVRNSPH